jgi:urea transport system substrate-binding protein
MKEIRVGILHSLSGTMASSEMHLVDAALFAIDEINKQGGVLGRQLLGVVEDGCSDPGIFKLKTAKLLEQDGIHVVSGCWTSSSRKAVLDNIQDNNVFLLYPVQYEGLEENPNVLYSGSCLNQQISPRNPDSPKIIITSFHFINTLFLRQYLKGLAGLCFTYIK